MQNRFGIFELKTFYQCYKFWDVFTILNKPYMVIPNLYYYLSYLFIYCKFIFSVFVKLNNSNDVLLIFEPSCIFTFFGTWIFQLWQKPFKNKFCYTSEFENKSLTSTKTHTLILKNMHPTNFFKCMSKSVVL